MRTIVLAATASFFLALVALNPYAWKAADGEGNILVGKVSNGVCR